MYFGIFLYMGRNHYRKSRTLMKLKHRIEKNLNGCIFQLRKTESWTSNVCHSENHKHIFKYLKTDQWIVFQKK